MSTTPFRLATWNVNSLKVRLPHLAQWLQSSSIDALGLQETKTVDADFPASDLSLMGLGGAWHGQKTYNGKYATEQTLL